MSDKNHWLLGEKTACGLPTNRANYGCRTRQMFLALNPVMTCARERAVFAAEAVAERIGNVRARDLSARIMEGYVAERRKEVGSGCVAVEIKLVSGALKYAKRLGDWHGTWDDIKPRNPKDDREQRTRWLTPEEAGALTAQLPQDRADWVWLGIYTGLRHNELDRLTWSQVDLKAKLLRADGTKSRKSKRTIPLAPKAVDLLARRKAKNLEPADRWPYPYKTLRRACAKAGIEYAMPHDLRRTFASWLAQAGVFSHAIADLLGQEGEELVRSVYAHLGPEHLRAAVEKLP